MWSTQVGSGNKQQAKPEKHARDKQTSLLYSSVSDEEKSFIRVTLQIIPTCCYSHCQCRAIQLNDTQRNDTHSAGKYLNTTETTGLYYKHMTIINYDSSIIIKRSSKLIDPARGVIYDHHMFIIQATGHLFLTNLIQQSVIYMSVVLPSVVLLSIFIFSIISVILVTIIQLSVILLDTIQLSVIL